MQKQTFIKIKNPDFDEIYSDMFLQFPKEEMKSKEHFQKLFETDNYKIESFLIEKNLLGYVLFFEAEYLWVDYFAIYPKYQGLGFGTTILKEFFEEKNSKGCFFEVEQVDFKNEYTLKRQDFYKKLGCEKLDYKYFFPNNYKELEMDLFYKKLSNNKLPTTDEIKNFTKKVFDNIHQDIKKLKTF